MAVVATSPATPQLTAKQEDYSTLKFTIEEIDLDVPWYDITITLIDKDEDYTRETWSWNPPYPQGSGTQTLLSYWGTPALFCNVTDLAGNGYINIGDFLVIEPNGTGFDPTSVDELMITYDPTGSPMWVGELRGGKLVAPSEFPWIVPSLALAAGIAAAAFLLVRRRKKAVPP